MVLGGRGLRWEGVPRLSFLGFVYAGGIALQLRRPLTVQLDWKALQELGKLLENLLEGRGLGVLSKELRKEIESTSEE